MKRRPGAPQGESLVTWGIWALLLVVMLITYWRLPPDTRLATDDLYHVSGNGVVGGLSRVLVEVNFPLAIVAVLLVLVALDALPARAWLAAAPAVALCAVVAWPGVVDQDDLDARWVNVVPALGVGLALALTIAAARRAGRGLAGPLPLDRVRIAIVAVMLFLAIPWIPADLGFFLPDGIFIMRRVAPDTDGAPIAAVHLGHHHGMDGTLVAVAALLLSRPRLRAGRTGRVTLACVSLAFAYGAVNCAQDAWHEQLVKRGVLDWKIPSAVQPKLAWIWLVIVALGALTALVLRRESAAAARVDSPG